MTHDRWVGNKLGTTRKRMRFGFFFEFSALQKGIVRDNIFENGVTEKVSTPDIYWIHPGSTTKNKLRIIFMSRITHGLRKNGKKSVWIGFFSNLRTSKKPILYVLRVNATNPRKNWHGNLIYRPYLHQKEIYMRHIQLFDIKIYFDILYIKYIYNILADLGALRAPVYFE